MQTTPKSGSKTSRASLKTKGRSTVSKAPQDDVVLDEALTETFPSSDPIAVHVSKLKKKMDAGVNKHSGKKRIAAKSHHASAQHK